MSLRLIISVFTLTISLSAQTFHIYPADATTRCTTSASRGSLGTASGDLLQEYAMQSRTTAAVTTDHFRGIGQTTAGGVPGPCQVKSAYYLIQDNNCLDQESYSLRIRRLAVGGSGPDPAASGLVVDVPLLSPPGGSGACAWGIAVVFATPVTVPCDRSWFGGLRLSAAAGFPANGLFLHSAAYAAGTVGDVPRADASNLSWHVQGATVSQPGTAQALDISWSIGSCPTLVLANRHGTSRCGVDPAPGVGGIYPSNTLRGDGLCFQIRETVAAPVVVWWSPVVATAPAGAAFFSCAPLWLPLVPPPGTIASGMTISGGTTNLCPIITSPGLLRFLGGGTTGPDLWFQAIVIRSLSPVDLALTNAASVDFSATL